MWSNKVLNFYFYFYYTVEQVQARGAICLSWGMQLDMPPMWEGEVKRQSDGTFLCTVTCLTEWLASTKCLPSLYPHTTYTLLFMWPNLLQLFLQNNFSVNLSHIVPVRANFETSPLESPSKFLLDLKADTCLLDQLQAKLSKDPGSF